MLKRLGLRKKDPVSDLAEKYEALVTRKGDLESQAMTERRAALKESRDVDQAFLDATDRESRDIDGSMAAIREELVDLMVERRMRQLAEYDGLNSELEREALASIRNAGRLLSQAMTLFRGCRCYLSDHLVLGIEQLISDTSRDDLTGFNREAVRQFAEGRIEALSVPERDFWREREELRPLFKAPETADPKDSPTFMRSTRAAVDRMLGLRK